MIELIVILDDWTRPGSPASSASPATWAGYCAQVYSAAPRTRRNRWVMNMNSYCGLLAEVGLNSGYRSQAYAPGGVDMLFGVPIVIRNDGGLPHLE